MAVSVASMRALEKQVKVVDNAIEHQFEIIPNTLTSIPGIGKGYSAGIIAEIGKSAVLILRPLSPSTQALSGRKIGRAHV